MQLEELFARHHDGLFRFVSRMTGDPEFAKDVVQETFLAVVSKPPPPGVERAWLYRQALGLARSGLRKQRRRWLLLREGAAAVPVAQPSPTPDTDAERGEARAAVRAALAQLSERERTILLMREEGFTHREIADAVGTTTGSIGTMFARALAKLAERLGEVWQEST